MCGRKENLILNFASATNPGGGVTRGFLRSGGMYLQKQHPLPLPEYRSFVEPLLRSTQKGQQSFVQRRLRLYA